MAKRVLTPEQEDIQKDLRNYHNNNSIKWPSHIGVEESNDIITLTLTSEAIGLAKESDNNKNMQDNDACFEGWAVALKATNDNITINLNVNGLLPLFVVGNGHYGRFLYRALRFSEQYDWFHLCGDLKPVVNAFEKNILKNNKLINNGPGQDDAGTNDKLECRVETKMAENKKAFLACLQKAGIPVKDNQNVYRQLPVGLFFNTVKDTEQVFTGGASAIDLWTVNEDKKIFQAIELKADNKMIGIITEIFFYSNYMYDLLFGNFLLNTDSEKQNRGYTELMETDNDKKDKASNKKNFTGIQGIMLADIYHPLITDKVVDVLNNGNKREIIKYFKAEYDFDVKVKTK